MRSVPILVLVLAASVYAQESGFVKAPHEHGAALLNIVLDGEILSMEFVSPAVNLIGFEYEPTSDDEVKAVDEALAQLQRDTILVPAAAAACELTSAEAEHLMADKEGHEESEGRGEAQADEGRHSEVYAAYVFTCALPDRLSSVDLSALFAFYSGVEDLGVQYVLPGGQGAVELGPDTPLLKF